MKKESPGKEIARRRKQLIWNQAQLAEAAGVGLSTVVSAEKDRPLRGVNRKAIERALADEEKRRGVTYPDLPAGTNGGTLKEGADVPASTKLRAAIHRLEGLEIFALQLVEGIRRAKTELSEDIPEDVVEDRRKRG